MKTKTVRTFDLQHDSGKGLTECLNLVDFLEGAMPGYSVQWESVKSHFGCLVITQETDTADEDD